jgi:hypothetical protein
MGRNPLLYTVYNNKTDMPVVIDGTAEECAKAMKMTPESFYSAVTHARTGKIKKWYIESIKQSEVDYGY